MTDPTTPGPECGTLSRPIHGSTEGWWGQCDGCYGQHPMTPTLRGWRIKPHQSSDPTGTECPNCPHGTVYDPPVYCRVMAPFCDRCLQAMPDGYDEWGRPIWNREDGTPEYRESTT